MMKFFNKYPDRKKLVDRIKNEIERAGKNGDICGLIVVKLTRLKEINREFGYDFGDFALSAIHEMISEILGSKDYSGRLGDNEFGVLLTNSRGAGDCILFTNRLKELCNNPVKKDDRSLKLRILAGIAVYPEHASTYMNLLKCADHAVSRAETCPEGYYVYPEQEDENTTTMFAMEGELEKAINNGAIDFYYQPKIDIKSGTLQGFETLARWQNERWGNVRPDIFIGAAEKADLITPLTIDCLTRTLKDISRLQQQYHSDITLSVNLSASILSNRTSIERVINTISIWCDRPETLILEITEGAVMDDPDASREILRQLHDESIKISIDDFGTGYSSLSYLKNLTFDELKVDKSFVMDLLNNEDDIKLVRTIIALANNFNLETVAEGIEDKETLQYLGEIGCSQAQGYYISRPLPLDQATAWIDAWQPGNILTA